LLCSLQNAEGRSGWLTASHSKWPPAVRARAIDGHGNSLLKVCLALVFSLLPENMPSSNCISQPHICNKTSTTISQAQPFVPPYSRVLTCFNSVSSLPLYPSNTPPAPLLKLVYRRWGFPTASLPSFPSLSFPSSICTVYVRCKRFSVLQPTRAIQDHLRCLAADAGRTRALEMVSHNKHTPTSPYSHANSVCRRAAIPTNNSKIFPSSLSMVSRADGDVAASGRPCLRQTGTPPLRSTLRKKKKKKPKPRMRMNITCCVSWGTIFRRCEPADIYKYFPTEH
jgi:hypothetical protein